MIKKCIICEKKFRQVRKDIKCCSIKCSQKNRTIKTKSKICKVCFKTFYRKIGTGIKLWERQKSCSMKCGITKGNVYRIGKKISEETRKKIIIARSKQDMSHMKGESHPNWKGGITPIQSSIRHLNMYRNWRASILKRDDFTCIECGDSKKGRLNVDHIKAFSVILEENNITTSLQAKSCDKLWDVKNGRTLCVFCHRKTDTYAGKKKL